MHEHCALADGTSDRVKINRFLFLFLSVFASITFARQSSKKYPIVDSKDMEYLSPNRCTSTSRLDGKTAVVTGSNSGVGKETALEFYRRGARVIMACRSESRTQAAIERIKQKTKKDQNVGELVFRQLDLSSWESVRKCAREILDMDTSIDVLVNNAGIAMCSKTLSENGIELQFATNHLGHFLFTLLLLPRILKSTSARIINISSTAHKWGDQKMHFDDINLDKNYTIRGAYSRSKLANVLFTAELIRRLNGTCVTAYAVNPGLVCTNIGRFVDRSVFWGTSAVFKCFSRIFGKTPADGVQTTLHCALDDKCAEQNGLYYSNCKLAEPSPTAKDEEACRQLWDNSRAIVCLDPAYDPFEFEKNVL